MRSLPTPSLSHSPTPPLPSSSSICVNPCSSVANSDLSQEELLKLPVHIPHRPKKDRPKITRSTFVCAEPMPGEDYMLKEFVGQLEPKLLGQLVEVVFDKMKLAGEAGSLLKIEEEIRDALAEAKKQWVRETTQATDR